MTPRAGTMWLLFFTPTIERDEEMKLLIIDDEEGIRSSLKSLFRSEGYTLLEADDGLSGERLLREERPEVTITDIRLPGKSGLDLLETVRKEALPTETIIITGYGDVDLAVQATRAGAFDFIEKPFSPDRILLTVRNAFEKAALSQARRGTLEAELAGALIVGESSPVQALKEKIRQVAPSDATVLILGESGSGKELVAKNLHLLSRRSLQPYVHLNCAAIPEELLESELFGHRKGSFTGAIENKKGKFEEAQGGTLFLDEIGYLSLRAQAKVLRIIENGEVQRIGETEVKRVDVRTVAATNKKLVEEIGRGSFREDLFFRLNVVTLEVPPLRERRDDIPLLMDHFSRRIASETGQKPKEFSPELVENLTKGNWKGNIRELKHFMERVYIFVPATKVGLEEALALLQPTSLILPSPLHFTGYREYIKEAERKFLTVKLRSFGGNVAQTAREIGISRVNLIKKLKELKVSPSGAEERSHRDDPGEESPNSPGQGAP